MRSFGPSLVRFSLHDGTDVACGFIFLRPRPPRLGLGYMSEFQCTDFHVWFRAVSPPSTVLGPCHVGGKLPAETTPTPTLHDPNSSELASSEGTRLALLL